MLKANKDLIGASVIVYQNDTQGLKAQVVDYIDNIFPYNIIKYPDGYEAVVHNVQTVFPEKTDNLRGVYLLLN